jgi:GNAT superfamily N-acetyltransferase
MAAGGVRLERVLVRDLPALARRAANDGGADALIPITLARARAQAANPAAGADDVGLLVASVDGRRIGYLGLVPVRTTGCAGSGKAAFLSTYFVAPQHRNTGAGTLLMLESMALGVDLFVAGFAEITRKVCMAMGFRDVGPIEILCLRLDAGIGLPLLIQRGRDRFPAGPHARAIELARRLSRSTLEPILRWALVEALRLTLGTSRRRVLFVPVERVTTPAGAAALSTPGDAKRFVRDDDVVNWMLHNPWLVQGKTPAGDYAFSSCRRRFRFLAFTLRDGSGGADLGYVVLRLSDDGRRTDLTILDAVYTEPALAAHTILLALREARRHGADRIVCGGEYAQALAGSRLLRLLTLREQRGALFLSRAHSDAAARGPVLVPGICDGDAPYV